MIRFLSHRPMFTILSTMVVMLLIIWIISRLIAWGTCSWYGYQTERDTRYAAFIGCMVEVDGKWYPRNELRVVQ